MNQISGWGPYGQVGTVTERRPGMLLPIDILAPRETVELVLNAQRRRLDTDRPSWSASSATTSAVGATVDADVGGGHPLSVVGCEAGDDASDGFGPGEA